MVGGRALADRLALASVVAMPLLILGGMLEWLIPATSTHAAGHGLGFAVLGAYPFLFLWLGASLLTIRRVARLPQAWAAAALPPVVAALQWVLVGVALAGGIPLLTFDLAPDASAAVAGAFTATVFPLVVIGVSIAQLIVLGRVPRDDGTAVPELRARILHRAPLVRLAAAGLAIACTLAAGAFLVEELSRVAVGDAGEYGVLPFVLLLAVVAAGLPSSWVVAALASLTLVAHPMAGLGAAPGALDAAAIVAVAVPAVVNAARAARIALSESALRRRIGSGPGD